MTKSERGEVVFDIESQNISEQDRITIKSLVELRNIVKNGWPDETEIQPQEVLVAEQAVDRFLAGQGREAWMRQKLDALSPEQRTRVVRRFVYSLTGQGKPEKAVQLNKYELNQKETDLNIVLMALCYEQKESFEKAAELLNQVSDDELREDMLKIIQQNKNYRLVN
jgi:hypothetical protein